MFDKRRIDLTRWVVSAAMALLVCGCASEPGDETPRANGVTVNTDPSDPKIMEVIGGEFGQKLTYVGTKDANGVVTGVTEVRYWSPTMALDSAPYTMRLGADHWPTAVEAPDGSIATITYDAANMTVSYSGADGSSGEEVYPLPEGHGVAAKVLRTSPLPMWWDWDDVPEDAYVTVRTTLALMVEHLDFGSAPEDVTLTGARVSLAGPANATLANMREHNGVYEFEIIHRVKNLTTAEQMLSAGENATGGVLTLVGLCATAAADVLSTATLGPGGLLLTRVLSYGTAAVGLMIVAGSAYCGDMVVQEAIAEGLGAQQTTLVIAHDDLEQPHTLSYAYDVFVAADPVMAADARRDHGRIEESVLFSACGYLAGELARNEAAVAGGSTDADAQCTLARNRQLMIEALCPQSFDEDAVLADYDRWCTGNNQGGHACDLSGAVTFTLLDAVVESYWGELDTCEQAVRFTNHGTEDAYLMFYVSDSSGDYGLPNSWGRRHLLLEAGATKPFQIGEVRDHHLNGVKTWMFHSKYMVIAFRSECLTPLNANSPEIDAQIDAQVAQEWGMVVTPLPQSACE